MMRSISCIGASRGRLPSRSVRTTASRKLPSAPCSASRASPSVAKALRTKRRRQLPGSTKRATHWPDLVPALGFPTQPSLSRSNNKRSSSILVEIVQIHIAISATGASGVSTAAARSASPYICGDPARAGAQVSADKRGVAAASMWHRPRSPSISSPPVSARDKPRSPCRAWRTMASVKSSGCCWRTRCEMGITNCQGPAA